VSIIDEICGVVSIVARFINQTLNVTNYYSTKSLSEVTKLTRVEPLAIISKDCLNLDYMPDISQALLSIFSGYYLQAISLLTNVNDVEVVRILDKLNPDRDSTGWLLSDSISKESINNLVLENYKYSLPTINSVALEGDKGDKHGQDIQSLNEVSNLSVGKMLNVTIAYNKTDEVGNKSSEVSSIKIPVSVRIMASIIPNATISNILALKTESNTLTERYHAWRSGRISFIKDLIFCQDLIDEHKKAMITDESGTVQEIMRRVNNSKKFGLLSKNPSLVSASNLFVISEEVAREVESKLGGKLSNPRIREKAFENTYAMIIAVVDREWERVTFYSRGISTSTNLSVKEIKQASKGKGPDIMDILKSYNLGAAPSF